MNDLNILYKQKPSSYYSMSRPEMLNYVPSSASNILEIGCGAGSFASLLKSQRPSVELWGLDIQAGCCDEMKMIFKEYIHGNFENDDIQLPLDYFDCVIMNDVLEHLYDPWKVLNKIKQYLHSDGYITLSVPNMRYYNILVDLIFNKRWSYVDKGVLDKTHIRFFTKNSLESMLTECGYRIVSVDGINSRYVSKKYALLNLLLNNLIDDINYMQFAVLARVVK